MTELKDRIKYILGDIDNFTSITGKIALRSYQRDVAAAIIESIQRRRGLTIVVMFPRQSGKNELQAQIESYLLLILSQTDAEIVSISPTWKPQTDNAMRRLERALNSNLLTKARWQKNSGYIFRIGAARIMFMSGSPEANVVGATASTLLSIDEAQDIEINKFDKEIAPMCASTNATKVFWGTAWTNQTLLSREFHAAQTLQAQDGIRRVFRVTADEVSREVEAYHAFVNAQIAKLGRNNPMVKSQFFCEEIDQDGGLFPTWRTELMAGDHLAQNEPIKGKIYAFLIDVAGQDEGLVDLGELENTSRDSTSLTIVELDYSTIDAAGISMPVYKCVHREEWIGTGHKELYQTIKRMINYWSARYIVIDSTGVGAGISGFLSVDYGDRVIPVQFNRAIKSELGWKFISIVDTGRWKEFKTGDKKQVGLQQLYFEQLSYCEYEIMPGPGKVISWGVKDGKRRPQDGMILHDDFILSACLCGMLEELNRTIAGELTIIRGIDPIGDIEHEW